MNTDVNDTPELPANPDGAEAPKPKRRTRAKPAVSDAAAGEAGSEASAAADAPEAPAKPARAPRKPRSKPAEADAALAEAPIRAPEPAPTETPPAVDVAPQEDGDGPAPDGEDGDAEGGRRSRNRRRGRRGSRKGEGEGAERVDDGTDSAVRAAAEPAGVDTGEVFASVLAGDYDALPEEAVAEADGAEAGDDDEAPALAEERQAEPEGDDKRVLAPDVDAPKLHKVLAQSGVGSRRDMEQAIEQGRVQVNGEAAHVGMRISFGDRITLDGKPVRVRIAPPPARVIAYHKPVGEVVSLDDPQQRPTVFRRLPRLQHGKWQSVGRLDINTEGLLLFTTSGDLANKLMHPRFGVEREYAVRVLGTLEKEQRDRLLSGVEIDGQAASFKSVEDGGGEGVNHWYRVVITEGRNREVRKLFDGVGLTVSRLIRIRYGCVVLPRGLKRGACVDLAVDDVKALRRLTDQPQSRDGGKPQQGRGNDKPRNGQRDERSRDDRQGGGKPRGQGQSQGQGQGQGQAQGQQGRRQRDERPPRQDRQDRPPREDRGDYLDGREPGDPSRIPNPLQQTYDRRHVQRERAGGRDADYENGPIPNPLQQTYDKRFVQGERGFGGGKRGGKGGGGQGGGQGGQPDPMRTSVGYIGADAFAKKMQGRGGGGGGGGGRRGGRR